MYLKSSITTVKPYGIWAKMPSAKITKFYLRDSFLSIFLGLLLKYACVGGVFVCVHFTPFVIPLERSKTWALRSECKLTERLDALPAIYRKNLNKRPGRLLIFMFFTRALI